MDPVTDHSDQKNIDSGVVTDVSALLVTSDIASTTGTFESQKTDNNQFQTKVSEDYAKFYY